MCICKSEFPNYIKFVKEPPDKYGHLSLPHQEGLNFSAAFFPACERRYEEAEFKNNNKAVNWWCFSYLGHLCDLSHPVESDRSILQTAGFLYKLQDSLAV